MRIFSLIVCSILLQISAYAGAAEEPARGQARHVYVVCLLQHAQALSKTSDDSADAVSLTVFASCTEQRKKLLESYEANETHEKSVELVDVFDNEIKKGIILMIVTTRKQIRPSSATDKPDHTPKADL